MTANARIPIDPKDPKIPLTEGLKVPLEFTAEADQKDFLDAKRETVVVQDLVYDMINGYLPREDDWTDHNGVKTLQGNKVTKYSNNPVPTPEVDNTEIPSFNGGPPDWKVVPEGTTSIPIIGKLLPQDNVEEIRTSLAIPEGCFTASPYGLRHGKPGTHSRTNEDSGGPAPGIDCPGAGNGDATPSIPTLQEPPSAAC